MYFSFEVPPRFELGSLDSKSRVLTITPWDRPRLTDRESGPTFPWPQKRNERRGKRELSPQHCASTVRNTSHQGRQCLTYVRTHRSRDCHKFSPKTFSLCPNIFNLFFLAAVLDYQGRSPSFCGVFSVWTRRQRGGFFRSPLFISALGDCDTFTNVGTLSLSLPFGRRERSHTQKKLSQ